MSWKKTLQAMRSKRRITLLASCTALVLTITGYQNCGTTNVSGVLSSSSNSGLSSPISSPLSSTQFTLLPFGSSFQHYLLAPFIQRLRIQNSTLFASAPGTYSSPPFTSRPIANNGGGLFIGAPNGQSLTSNLPANAGGANDSLVMNNEIFVATANGLAISKDGGQTFKLSTFFQSSLPIVTALANLGTSLYAGTVQNGLFVSVDGGVTFTQITTQQGLGSNMVISLFVLDQALFVGTTRGLSVSMDGGKTFTNKTIAQGLPSNVIFDIFATATQIYVTTEAGLALSTDGANSFQRITTAQGLGSNSVSGTFVDTGGVVYVGTTAGLSISMDGGKTFSTKTTAQGLVSNFITSVTVAGGVIYAADKGAVSVSADGGQTFTSLYPSLPAILGRVEQVGAFNGSIYAVTNSSSGLSISFDNGATFSDVTVTSMSSLVRSLFVSDATLFVTTGSDLLASKNGKDFVPVSGFPTGGAVSVDKIYVSNGVIYVAGGNGDLLMSSDGGTTFLTLGSAQGLGIAEISAVYVSNGTIYLMTGGLGVAISRNNGSSFTTQQLCGSGVNTYGTSVTGLDNSIYFGTSCGLFVSNDAGMTFTQLGNVMVNDIAVASGSGTVYVATPQGLYSAPPGGTSLSLVTNFNPMSILSLVISNNVLYVGTASGLYGLLVQ